MVRFINPLESKIKAINKKEFERVSDEGAHSLKPLSKGIYEYGKGKSIIIEKTRVTNTEMLQKAINEIDNVLFEYVSMPLHITQPVSYVEIQSVISGKYQSILSQFSSTVRMLQSARLDSRVNTHISVYLEGMRSNPNGKQIDEYIFKNVKSLSQLFKKINWFNDKMNNIYDKKGNKRDYYINFVFYQDLG